MEMEFVNNNKKPITVFQYKYHEGEFGKLLSGAFLDFTKDEEKISIFAKDKQITVHREPLLLFSPVVRSALDSLSCCAKPALSLPDCSSLAVQHLLRILKCGAADFEGGLNTSEIIVVAKCLQIDVTNFEYVKREARGLVKNPKIGQTKLTVAESGESDSDLDENEVDDYGEEDDELDVNMEIDTDRVGTKVNEETDSQMQSLLDDDVNDGQDTLDEKAENISFTFNDGSNDSTSSSGFPIGSQTCQICNKKSRNLSYLWQHYCKTHFMKHLRIDCDQFVNSKDLKCEICEEVLPSKQELYLHVGINHEKLNLVLHKNGLKPLESVKNESEKPFVEDDIPEDKKDKFRILRKTGQISKPEVPAVGPTHVPAFPDSYHHQPISGLPQYTARHQMAPQSFPQPFQNRYPSLPVSSQPPIGYNNPPQTRPLQSTHAQPQRTQPPPRYPTQYNPQQVSVPPTKSSMGLWAQSAKPVQPNPTPNPGSVQVEPSLSGPIRPMTNQDLTRAQSTPGSSTCQICQKTTPSLASLWQHYARMHFFAELKSDYCFMANIANKSCNECGSQFKAVDALFLHIGTVHRKVNEIIEKKGLVCLEMPNSRSRKSM